MRKVIYAMSVSLDGFIEATNGDLGWSFPDEELHKHFNDRESTIVALARSNESAAKLPVGKVAVLRGDVTDVDILHQGLAQADAVIYLAIHGIGDPGIRGRLQ